MVGKQPPVVVIFGGNIFFALIMDVNSKSGELLLGTPRQCLYVVGFGVGLVEAEAQFPRNRWGGRVNLPCRTRTFPPTLKQ